MSDLDLGADIVELTVAVVNVPSESHHEGPLADMVERALGRKDPYQLLMQAKAEVDADPRHDDVREAFAAEPQEPYDTEKSRAALIAKLREKHGLGPG